MRQINTICPCVKDEAIQVACIRLPTQLELRGFKVHSHLSATCYTNKLSMDILPILKKDHLFHKGLNVYSEHKWEMLLPSRSCLPIALK